jgi:hypothetical protein
MAVANEKANEFINDIGETGNYLKIIGARDDNGIVYAVGEGMEKTSEALTMVKGMADEVVENFRQECDKRFDQVENQCKSKADDFEAKCNDCENEAQKCEKKMQETKLECEKHWDICSTCRRKCEDIQKGACDWGNVIHENILTDTAYGTKVNWCYTQWIAVGSTCWIPGVSCFDREKCEREADEWRDSEKRRHQQGYKDCIWHAKRNCLKNGAGSLVEDIFEDGDGECDQICDVAFHDAMTEFGCQKNWKKRLRYG